MWGFYSRPSWLHCTTAAAYKTFRNTPWGNHNVLARPIGLFSQYLHNRTCLQFVLRCRSINFSGLHKCRFWCWCGSQANFNTRIKSNHMRSAVYLGCRMIVEAQSGEAPSLEEAAHRRRCSLDWTPAALTLLCSHLPSYSVDVLQGTITSMRLQRDIIQGKLIENNNQMFSLWMLWVKVNSAINQFKSMIFSEVKIELFLPILKWWQWCWLLHVTSIYLDSCRSLHPFCVANHLHLSVPVTDITQPPDEAALKLL